MRKLLTALLCGGVLVAGVMVSMAPADARRGGGFHRGGGGHHAMRRAGAGRHINRSRHVDVRRNRNVNVNRSRHVTRQVDRHVNRRYIYRNGSWGYWRNGVWIVAPAAAYTAACAYEYGRWQATGSSYWRDRYYQCVD